MAEDRQVPAVLTRFDARVGGGETDMTGQRPRQVPILCAPRFGQFHQRGHLGAARGVAHPGQGRRACLGPVAGALLEPEQHLGDDQVRQSAQAHQPGFKDRGLGATPQPLVQVRFDHPALRNRIAWAAQYGDLPRCVPAGTRSLDTARTRSGPTPGYARNSPSDILRFSR